jgi:hypothetical protein
MGPFTRVGAAVLPPVYTTPTFCRSVATNHSSRVDIFQLCTQFGKRVEIPSVQPSATPTTEAKSNETIPVTPVPSQEAAAESTTQITETNASPRQKIEEAVQIVFDNTMWSTEYPVGAAPTV